MKIPVSWLKKFLDLSQYSSTQIGKALTMSGLELDAIETVQPSFHGVVVANVEDVQSHPNADQLKIAKVSDGTKTYQVVCGVSNCRVGIKSAFAPVGATLTDESGNTFKIKPAELRGVASEGMLCSGKELGISDEWDGIMEFTSHISIGSHVDDLYSEELYEVSLTPNLAHCASVIGVARELSAALKIELTVPEIHVEEEGESIESTLSVNLHDKTRCPRYAARVIKGLKLGSSPEWMQKQLLAAGIRPINNIVDITNYVMVEIGQPLHAFDLSLVEGAEIHIQAAKAGEKFVTLDSKVHILTEEDLLICDKNKSLAIAGIMGGKNAEVQETTTDIILESAYFDPVSVRRTSKRLGIQSESSKRFERGCDPNATLKALDRAAELYAKYASGKVAPGILDIKTEEFKPKKVKLRHSRINKILGTHFGISEVEEILNRLQFVFAWDQKDQFTVTIPTYRVDIHQEIDLVEEVARIWGLENLPKKEARLLTSTIPHAPMYLFEKEVRAQLISSGLQEMLTCDLIGPKLLDIVKETSMPRESMVEVLNPTSIEQSILRASLLPGLLQVVKYNIDHGNLHLSGFEVGRIHFKEKTQYRERSVAGIILTGNRDPFHFEQKAREVDFFDLKGIIENVLQELACKKYVFTTGNLKVFHPGRQATIEVDGVQIGSFGEVHPSIRRRLDVKQRIFFAEFDLHDLLQRRDSKEVYHPISIYPGSDRDWTVTIPEELSIGEIFDWIHAVHSPYLETAELIDIYRDEKIGKGKKNITLRFFYRDREKTIQQKNVDQEHQNILKSVQNKLT
ncbi:MAG: phenylalanine--tRNA ligase subunit beta [Waddliaceae bacterium]